MRAAARGSAEAAQVLIHARSDLGAQDSEGFRQVGTCSIFVTENDELAFLFEVDNPSLSKDFQMA